MNILVIEDNPEMKGMLVDMLSAMGHSVSTASDGAAALKIVRNDTVDLAVCDIMMDGMGGIEFMLGVRDRVIPLVMMSGLSREQVVAEILQTLGIVGFLRKPFGLNDLRALVEHMDQNNKSAAA